MTKGTYSALYMEEDCAKRLYKWSKSRGLDPQPFDEMHCTTAYSRKRIAALHDNVQSERIYSEANPIKWMMLGPALVIKIDSSDAVFIHNVMKDMGCTYDFDTYIPHTTINPNYEGDLPTELPNWTFVYDRLIVKELDLDK